MKISLFVALSIAMIAAAGGLAYSQTGTRVFTISPAANPVLKNTNVFVHLYSGGASLVGEIDYAPSGLCSATAAAANVPFCRTGPDSATRQCQVYNGSLNGTKFTFDIGAHNSYVLCGYVVSGGPAGYSSNAIISTEGNSTAGSSGAGGTGTSGSGGGGGVSNTIVGSVCGIYTTVRTAIFIVALLLIILGGVIYAGSHIMPGQSKGSMQGYGMGMVLGGVIGLIIAVLSPYIFQLITGNSMIISMTCH